MSEDLDRRVLDRLIALAIVHSKEGGFINPSNFDVYKFLQELSHEWDANCFSISKTFTQLEDEYRKAYRFAERSRFQKRKIKR